jgi:hypothetical protein
MEALHGKGADGVVHWFDWEMATGYFNSPCGIKPRHDMGPFTITKEPVSCMLCMLEMKEER